MIELILLPLIMRHLWSEKEGTYFNIAAGVPNVQHMLLSLLKMHDQGHMPLTTIVSKTAHQVADLFAIKDRGYVREGHYADLVVLIQVKVIRLR